MEPRIRRDSPIPLYYQIAEATRNAIAVGELKPGARLPSVRDAARRWGVNLHTIRKAYQELHRDGLVRMRGPRGTEVAAGAGTAPKVQGLAAFLSSCVRVAQTQFGLMPAQLGRLILERAAEPAVPVVRFIECSRAQAEGHCEELMRAWQVQAIPLVLSELTEFPVGIVVATYFHYNDIRRAWPHRLGEVRFVPIAPDAGLAATVRAAPAGGRHRLLVCELDEAKALNIAADLRTLFGPDRFEILPQVLRRADQLPRARSNQTLLVSPRAWAALTPKQRARVVHIRYCVRPDALEALGTSFGWPRAGETAAA